MNKLILITISFLAACSQLMSGQIQPVKVKDAKNGLFFTTCSGAVEDWASCYRKAQETCSTGYKIIEQNENANGGFRNLTFQCKK